MCLCVCLREREREREREERDEVLDFGARQSLSCVYKKEREKREREGNGSIRKARISEIP